MRTLAESMPGSTPSPPLSFADMVREGRGKHPIEIYQTVCRDGRALFGACAADRLIEEAQTLVAPTPSIQGVELALPRPLDAEYRFTDQSAQTVLDAAVAATSPGELILLFGVPTVTIAALMSSHDRQFAIRAEDNVIGEALRQLTVLDQRFSPSVDMLASAVIIDPPWYPPAFNNMLAGASAACRLGAQLFVSGPADGVRPTVAEERRAMLAFAAASGLVLVSRSVDGATYRTPAFELAAMRAAGLGVWMPQWRQGEALVFTKCGPAQPIESPASMPAFELTISGVRLRLLAQCGSRPGGDGCFPAPEVFPSVSARAPGRALANFWTSGNRCCVLPPGEALNAMLTIARDREILWPKGLDSEFSLRSSPGSIDQEQTLIHHLLQTIDRELTDSASLVGEASWNRTVSDARFLNGSSRAFLRALSGAPA